MSRIAILLSMAVVLAFLGGLSTMTRPVDASASDLSYGTLGN